ncbi:MAG: LysR family transcriptional regulator [Pseudomonas sp.]|uniref:LysR family transcriptional regulator n=1 Tax=Pseudomonas sp. TaxID=306 RepID=UPI003C79094A
MDYRYFLAVVDSGSLASAGERLHIAPSAVSRQIALLEEQVGIQLFDRRPRGMHLTAGGEALAAHARRARLEEEKLLLELRGNDYPGAKMIRVASTEGLSRNFLPQVMVAFEKLHPSVQYRLDVTTPSACVDKVRTGEVDIGITFSTAPLQAVNIEYSCRSTTCALMRTHHPLAREAVLSLTEMQPYPVALTAEGTTQRQLFDLACQLEGLTFRHSMVCNYSSALQEFVRQSDAIALASKVGRIGNPEDGLVSIPLSNSQLSERHIQILTMQKRKLPHVLERFVASLIERLDQTAEILHPEHPSHRNG